MESNQPAVESTLRKFRRPAVFIAAFVPAVLLLALPLYRPTNVPFLFLFFGRFHPLVLHFPIVLIILALLFEIARHYSLLKLGQNLIFQKDTPLANLYLTMLKTLNINHNQFGDSTGTLSGILA